MRASDDLLGNLLLGIPRHGPPAQKVLFVIGSGLATPVDPRGPGVPSANEIIKQIRRTLPELLHNRFDAAIENAREHGGNAYQAAFEFLGDARAANTIIKGAVLDALHDPSLRPEPAKFEDTTLGALLAPDYWNIRLGIDAIGRLYSEHPDVLESVILTTNFDPLIEMALKKYGVDFVTVPAVDDLSVSALYHPERVTVVHVHGYWLRTDSMHTDHDLTRPRPRLSGWLDSLFSGVRILVTGYGGWDDIIMAGLERAAARSDHTDVRINWAFYGTGASRSAPLQRLEQSAGLLPVPRLELYSGVDADALLPRFANELRKIRPTLPPSRIDFSPSEPRTSANDPCVVVHRALAAVSRAQRLIAMRNFQLASQSAISQNPGYGWAQDLGMNVRAEPSAAATAQALMVLEGLAAPAPLLAQLLARPRLDACAVSNGGGWTIAEREGEPLARITSVVVQVGARAHFAVSPREQKLGVQALLRSQHKSGGWGHHNGCAPDVITTSQVCVALTAALRHARDVLGDLLAVLDSVEPVEEVVRAAIAAAARFLIVRQATTGADRGRVHSGLDRAAGEVATIATTDASVPRIVRTAEAALAFRAISTCPDVDREVRGSASAALERAGAWLLDQSRGADALLPARFVEEWKGKLYWHHAVPEALLRGLLAAHVSPRLPEVASLASWIIDSCGEYGLWTSTSAPGVPAVFATKEAVLALRGYAYAMTRLDPNVLLNGPRMAVVDASHYRLYRGGIFGVTVVQPPHAARSERKVVHHKLPFGLPTQDMSPPPGDAEAVLRARLLVDIIARSTVEDTRVYLDREGCEISAAVAVLRGGLPFVAPLGDVFESVPFGLLSAIRAGDTVDVSWLVAPEREATSAVLLTDTVMNTGATMLACVEHLTSAQGSGASVEVVVVCAFAHEDALRKVAMHPAVIEIHVAEIVSTRSATGWLAGVDFDAGDLAMGGATPRAQRH